MSGVEKRCGQSCVVYSNCYHAFICKSKRMYYKYIKCVHVSYQWAHQSTSWAAPYVGTPITGAACS